MLPFIICLLIKKSKEGHILCRLAHNGLKNFFEAISYSYAPAFRMVTPATKFISLLTDDKY